MTLVVDDTDFQLHVGDVRDVLATLPDESVHCVVTSPPYWGLRDYGTGSWDGGDEGCDHVEKHTTLSAGDRYERYTPGGAFERGGDAMLYQKSCGKCGARRTDKQLGLEPTPDEYVANMVAVFREVRRVLRRDGTCWLNIGDSYNANVGAGFNANARIGHQDTVLPSGLPAKNLLGMPWRLAFALQADGWYLRSDIIWSKPNPMPESVTDRPTKAHEYLFLLTRSPRYFYDADAIREPYQPSSIERKRYDTNDMRSGIVAHNGRVKAPTGADYVYRENPPAHSAGRNRRSVWEIATEPYPDAHFATFPQALVEPCVLAGTSERGCCPVCGAPWEREIMTVAYNRADAGRTKGMLPGSLRKDGDRNLGGTQRAKFLAANPPVDLGWRPTCDHHISDGLGGRGPARYPVPCVVLDPFMGSGTTAQVARRLGRKSIGIELNAEYAQLAATRLQQLSLLA